MRRSVFAPQVERGLQDRICAVPYEGHSQGRSVSASGSTKAAHPPQPSSELTASIDTVDLLSNPKNDSRDIFHGYRQPRVSWLVTTSRPRRSRSYTLLLLFELRVVRILLTTMPRSQKCTSSPTHI